MMMTTTITVKFLQYATAMLNTRFREHILYTVDTKTHFLSYKKDNTVLLTLAVVSSQLKGPGLTLRFYPLL